MSEDINFDHRFTFTWHTNWLEPCRKCQSLNGKRFEGTSVFDGILYDPIWGNVWDIFNDLPLTHPNCKCYLEVTYEATLEELLFPSQDTSSIDVFKEFGIMTSNIKEMQKDIKEFEQDLSRAQSRLSNTRIELMTYLQLLQRMGLPPQVEKAITVMVKARLTSEQAARALYALQAASIAGGPAAWAFAAATTGLAALGAFSTASSVMELGGT